ncbi:MAG TPA: glycosyltransferase, partial [Anaeromyxobacter sp.]
ESLAHRIEAGADAFLMPSRYEPCGLNQMYSLRYGTVPVVRAVGGLEDTVEDYDGWKSGTGFKFRDYHPAALLLATRRALEVHRDRRAWRGIVSRGMAEDFSWDRSAARYEELYSKLAP